MITVLTGENVSELQQHLVRMKKEFAALRGDSGIETVNGETLKKEEVVGLLHGATLFSSHRFVILKHSAQNKDVAAEIIQQLSSVSEETHLVVVEPNLDKRTVFFKELKKQADIVNFPHMNEASAAIWVKEAVTKNGGSIARGDANFLIQRVGVDQSRLSNEVDKLLLISSAITRDAIIAVVEEDPRESIFQLLDSALSGDKKQTLHILSQLEAVHVDAHQIMGMVLWQVNIIAVVFSATNISESEIAKQMKISPYVVAKTRRLTRKLHKNKVRNIVSAAVDCDRQLKRTGAHAFTLLEIAIMRIIEAQ